MWLTILSDQLTVIALVGRYPANKLMAHGLLPRGQALRSPPLPDGPCGPYGTFGISASFPALSPPSGQIVHAFLALPPLSPVDIATARRPFDLHA